MAKKKLVYIISNINKSLAFEWTAVRLREHYDLTFLLLNPSSSAFEQFLLQQKIDFKRIEYHGKKNFIRAFLKIFFILTTDRPAIVHAHLLDAQLIGLMAAWALRIRKRIYTRHTSNFHHVYHPAGVKYDRLSNKLATNIISISQATDRTLFELEDVKREKVVKITHGFDCIDFENVDSDRVNGIKTRWKIPNDSFLIGVIARHIEWKGIQYIIPAFREFNKVVPNSILILANSSGPYHGEILEMIKDISPDKIIMVPFEEDVPALYRTFAMYIHTPVDSVSEAFGQTYIEALAAGIPSIFTLSGIADEFIRNEENALVVPFRDSQAVYNAMVRLHNDRQLQRTLIENGKRNVISRFGIDSMIVALRELYG